LIYNIFYLLFNTYYINYNLKPYTITNFESKSCLSDYLFYIFVHKFFQIPATAFLNKLYIYTKSSTGPGLYQLYDWFVFGSYLVRYADNLKPKVKMYIYSIIMHKYTVPNQANSFNKQLDDIG